MERVHGVGFAVPQSNRTLTLRRPEKFTMRDLSEVIIDTIKMPKTRIYKIPMPIAQYVGPLPLARLLSRWQDTVRVSVRPD